VLQLGAQHRVEEPGSDDVVRLRAKIHREEPGEQVGIVLPVRRDLRRQRRGRPRVHDVGVAHEPAGLPALGRLVAGRHRILRIDRQGGLIGQDRVVVARVAVLVERVPDGERHAEEPLAAHRPVRVQALDPRGVAPAHERRMPRDLFATGQQPVLECQGVHEPLPARDDLERSVALLVELHDVLHRLRFAHQVTGVAQQIGDPGARFFAAGPRVRS
jgi:hypothetical protein